MSKILIYDFEVFKYDVLMGVKELNDDGGIRYRLWGKEAIENFYYEHMEDIWVGHNNYGYDDLILQCIIKGGNPYVKSQEIIKGNCKYEKCNIQLYSYDNMGEQSYSLKLSELLVGKNIHETDVDFDLDRPLTEEEKKLTESYNDDDIDQTEYNFNMFINNFQLKIDMMKEFDLDFTTVMHASGTSLAAMILGARKNPDVVSVKYDMPYLKPLVVKDTELLNWYYNEDFRNGITLNREFGGCQVNIASGGAHGAINNAYFERALYFDVSGYYNLIMINYNLFSRSMPDKAKERYTYMYHEQLKMKKTNPRKRAVFKTVLLSVYGAQMNEHTDFYDPWKGPIVPVTGELFLVDLMEHLDGLINVIQYNTDGIIVEPKNWDDEQKIISIVEEWETRTGFVIKKDHIYNIWQRDVNNYMYFADKEKTDLHYVGYTNYDISDKGYASGKLFGSKEAPIIAKGVIDTLMYGKTPEQIVEENKHDLRYFQYACRKVSAEYMTYNGEKVQSVCRAFALRKDKGTGVLGKWTRVKKPTKSLKVGDLKYSKYPAIPENTFIYNNDIRTEEAISEINDKIDYEWYIDKIYDALAKFVGAKK